MKKAISLIYLVMVVVLLAISCIGYKAVNFKIYNPLLDEAISVIEPVEMVEVSEDIKEFYFILEDDTRVDQCLEFFTNHQRAAVYLDGELVYTLEGGNSIFGKTTGSKFNFVACPSGTKEIKVVIEAVYPQVRDREYEFLYGDDNAIYQQIVKNSIWTCIVSVLILFMGMFMVFYWCLMHKKSLMNPGLFYFGIFTLVLGGWLLIETDFMTLVMEDRALQSFCGYVLLMCLIIPFVLYTSCFFNMENKYVIGILCVASFVNIVSCTALHMTGIIEFKQSVYFTHGMMVAGITYMFVCLVKHFRRMGFDRKVRTNAIGAGTLALAVLVDLYSYYKGIQNTDVIGRIAFMLYILLLGIDNASESIKQINLGRKAELYREMAVTDMLTGLYNRNAFDTWENENTNFTETMIVTFDLNDLKWCNDTLGHALGDKYIADAAAMIQRVFGKIGDCYRIGGDEFCAVIKNAERVDIEVYLERLKRLQKEYNAHSKEVQIQIACGYATFSEVDKNIENTRSRADVVMYQNKKQLKNS